MRNKGCTMNKWLEKWSTETHIESKRTIFETTKNYLDNAPKRILDIGCGYARESEYFQKEFGTELWLLDGDFSHTQDRKREINFGPAESFKFYNKVDILIESYNEREMSYTFVDANNIQIPKKIKFDLIYSGLSCGFHYPANTYKDLILKHSNKNTKIIFDLRKKTTHENVKIINIIEKYNKHVKAEIEFV